MGCISLLKHIKKVAPQCVEHFSDAKELEALLPQKPSVFIVDGNVLYRKLDSDHLFNQEVFFSPDDPNGDVALNVARVMGRWIKSFFLDAFEGIPVKVIFDGPLRVLPTRRGPRFPERQKLKNNGIFNICFSRRHGSTGEGRRQVNKAFWPDVTFFESLAEKLEAFGLQEWGRPAVCRVALGEADFVINAIAKTYGAAVVISSDTDYVVFSEAMAMVRPHAE